MKYHTVSVRILGTVRSPIWMPATECTKDVDHAFVVEPNRFSRYHVRGNWPGSVRDALLSEHVTNDGDFQHCELEPGAVLIVTRVNPKTGTQRRREWYLRASIQNQQARGYIADCFTDEATV